MQIETPIYVQFMFIIDGDSGQLNIFLKFLVLQLAFTKPAWSLSVISAWMNAAQNAVRMWTISVQCSAGNAEDVFGTGEIGETGLLVVPSCCQLLHYYYYYYY